MAPDHGEYFSVPFPEFILESPPVLSMLQTAQNVAETYDLKRAELDAFAAASHDKTQRAYDKGIYEREVMALEVEDPIYDEQGNWLPDQTGKQVRFDRDECIRPGTTAEKLASAEKEFARELSNLVMSTEAELKEAFEKEKNLKQLFDQALEVVALGEEMRTDEDIGMRRALWKSCLMSGTLEPGVPCPFSTCSVEEWH